MSSEKEYVNRLLFEQELVKLINKYSVEEKSKTPDHILGKYLMYCLSTFEITMESRDDWYGENQPYIKPECNSGLHRDPSQGDDIRLTCNIDALKKRE